MNGQNNNEIYLSSDTTALQDAINQNNQLINNPEAVNNFAPATPQVYELQPAHEPRLEIINQKVIDANAPSNVVFDLNPNPVPIDFEPDEKISAQIEHFNHQLTQEEKDTYLDSIGEVSNKRRKKTKWKLVKTAILSGVLSSVMTITGMNMATAKDAPKQEEIPQYNTTQEVIEASKESIAMMETKPDAILYAYAQDVVEKIKEGKEQSSFPENYIYDDKFNEQFLRVLANRNSYEESNDLIFDPSLNKKSETIKKIHNRYRSSMYEINDMCYDLGLYKLGFAHSIYKDAIMLDERPGEILIPLDTLISKNVMTGEYTFSSLPENSTTIDGKVYVTYKKLNEAKEQTV